MVNKIPTELDNPIDVFLYNQIDKHLDFYNNIGFTPNRLTTLSLIFGLIGVYNLYCDNYLYGALFFFISYYFDCADGKFARKYDMVTKFGDIYDHFTDFIKVILLFYVMYKKSPTKFYKVLGFSVILSSLCMLYMNCQEKMYGKSNESVFLNLFNINLDNCEDKMKYLKYFGAGTLMTYFSICILFWDFI
jgi:phosphatidylglycerophosphate synthase